MAPREGREGGIDSFFLWRLVLVALLGVAAEGAVRLIPLVGQAQPLRVLVAVAYLLVGVSLTGRARRRALARLGEGPLSRSGLVNLVVHVLVVAAYLCVVVFAADMLRLSLAGLAFGGAITGVVLGLAAQSTLGNLFAGVVLLLLRPYVPGQWVSLRSWYSSGIEYTGRVRELNLFYTVLDDGNVRRVIPNTAALVSYVTVAGDGERRAFTASLPLRVPLAQLEEAILRAAGAPADIRVTALAPDAYTVVVLMPPGDTAAWEEALASFVRDTPSA